MFLFGCSEVNSTWIITSGLANQCASKALFTCVVYTNMINNQFNSNYLPQRAKVLTQRLHAFLSPRRGNVTQWSNYLPQRARLTVVCETKWTSVVCEMKICSLRNKHFLSRCLYSDIRELKIYDATVAKTSLKSASSSLSIFFVIISICATFES